MKQFIKKDDFDFQKCHLLYNFLGHPLASITEKFSVKMSCEHMSGQKGNFETQKSVPSVVMHFDKRKFKDHIF